NLPPSTYCPADAPYDVTLGCMCPNGQAFNGQTGQCQNLIQTLQTSQICPSGQFYDSTNNRCKAPDPQENPEGSNPENQGDEEERKGVEESGGEESESEPVICPRNSVREGPLCRCNRASDAYDIYRNACLYRQECPANVSVENDLLGCHCLDVNRQYDNLRNTCALSQQDDFRVSSHFQAESISQQKDHSRPQAHSQQNDFRVSSHFQAESISQQKDHSRPQGELASVCTTDTSFQSHRNRELVTDFAVQMWMG
ncbi:hypothetical protein PoB_005262100, partial [Plakobranchus ocellatus]